MPLNLATSIFGMNLIQLNSSGPELRVFIITAVLALFVTLASWLCIDQWSRIIAWRQAKPEYDHSTHTRFCFTVRLIMILWLLFHGHFRWMRITGAWSLILRGSQRELPSYPMLVPSDAWHLSAGEYVSKFSRESRMDGFEPFATNPVRLDWHEKGPLFRA